MTARNKNNLYLIPITDNSIFINGISLWKYVSTYYPSFERLEDERVSIIYSGSMYGETEEEKNAREKRYRDHTEFTKMCAEEARIPLYLIAVGSGNNVREITTNIKITSEYQAALDIRILGNGNKRTFEVPENYDEYSRNFLSKIIYEARNEKITYTIEEFLNINDLREKIRVAFGGFKSSINFDTEKDSIIIAPNGTEIDLSLLFIAKYNLDADDFIMLIKLRLLNRDALFDSMKSEFFNELDSIIAQSDILKKTIKERLLNLIQKNQTT